MPCAPQQFFLCSDHSCSAHSTHPPRHGPFMEESKNLNKIEICSLVWSLLMNGRIELILESVVYLLKLNKLEVLLNKSTDKRFSQYMIAVSE